MDGIRPESRIFRYFFHPVWKICSRYAFQIHVFLSMVLKWWQAGHKVLDQTSCVDAPQDPKNLRFCMPYFGTLQWMLVITHLVWGVRSPVVHYLVGVCQ